MIPFFSRQIGLLAGEEVPIDFGTKLTGRVGRMDLGVLNVRTRALREVDAKNFFVGRAKWNLLEAILYRRNRHRRKPIPADIKPDLRYRRASCDFTVSG